jgi:hypothetical protein
LETNEIRKNDVEKQIIHMETKFEGILTNIDKTHANNANLENSLPNSFSNIVNSEIQIIMNSLKQNAIDMKEIIPEL